MVVLVVVVVVVVVAILVVVVVGDNGRAFDKYSTDDQIDPHHHPLIEFDYFDVLSGGIVRRILS